MIDTKKFTSENELNKRLLTEIAHFWQQGLFSHFIGTKKVRIEYACLLQKKALNSIIIVPGRGESYLKYQELSYDLAMQGYNVFIIDHRGQGLSQRLIANPNKGYVENFQDYVNDLHMFITRVVNKFSATKPYLLAHSMGAAIAARYIQDYPGNIKAAILSSPMLGFNGGHIPENIAGRLIKQAEKINHFLSSEPWYFLGHKNFTAIAFDENKQTHSVARYAEYVNLYTATPNIQLGGVTVRWLVEGLRAQEEIFAKLHQITCPVLVFQASEDVIIKNKAQDDFCAQLNHIAPALCVNSKPEIIKGAYHEIFFEIDSLRIQALEKSLSWFKQH